MAKIKIGGSEFSVSRPKDLDDQLLGSTGCDAAEVAGMLRGRPLADLVARALAPFIAPDDRPSSADLAEAIGAAGVGDVAAQVAALYGEPAATPAPTPPTPAPPK